MSKMTFKAIPREHQVSSMVRMPTRIVRTVVFDHKTKCFHAIEMIPADASVDDDLTDDIRRAIIEDRPVKVTIEVE